MRYEKNGNNMKEKIGQVTTEERDEIQRLFERKNSLKELTKVLDPNNDALYQKMVNDMGETQTKFQGWWDRMAEKYQWRRSENSHWTIDFETCNIYIKED